MNILSLGCKNMIGIFGQEREEVATLLNNVTINQTRTIGNMTVYNVTYNGHNFYIIVSGVGKANVAFSLGYALVKLCVKKVIVVGNAASLEATTSPIGSVGIATNTLEWDVDFTSLGVDDYVVPPNIVSEYPVDVRLQKLALDASNNLGYQTVLGLIASGDTFVASTAEATQIATDTDADFLDIDSAPVGQIRTLLISLFNNFSLIYPHVTTALQPQPLPPLNTSCVK